MPAIVLLNINVHIAIYISSIIFNKNKVCKEVVPSSESGRNVVQTFRKVFAPVY